ncbi:TetR/AcrR family transcriptional regulator [Microbacterium sp. AGC85]
MITDGEPSTPSLRETQKAHTRAILIESATALFREKGYETTSVEDIVRQAGASRATFYLHFRHKSDLVAAISESFWAIAEDFFVDLGALPDWSEPSIRKWIAGEVLRWASKRETLQSLAGIAVTSSADAVQNRVAKLAHRIRVQDPRWSRWPEAEAELRARVIVNLLVSYNWSWNELGSVENRDADVNLLTPVVRAVLENESHDSIDNPVGE